MAQIIKRVRVANPRRRATVRKRNRGDQFVKRSAARRRNKRSAPVIRRYPVQVLKAELKRRGVKVNPRRKAAKRKVRRVRRSNPVLIELGAINPRRNSVAKTRKRRKTRNPRRRRAITVARVSRRRRSVRRRRRNPMVTTTVRRRTRVYNRRRRYARRRNPALNRSLLEKGGGILVGVAATKFLPTLLPANITGLTGGLGGFGPVLITGAGAIAAGWLAERFMPRSAFADGVLSGGIALTLSSLLNMLAPQLAGSLALRGMGDIVPTGPFPVPNNQFRMPMALPAPAANGGGMGAFRPAFRGAFR